MSPLFFNTGDLIFAKKRTKISKLISWFSFRPGEEKTRATHVLGFVDDKNFVVDCDITTKMYRFKIEDIDYPFEIFRNTKLSSTVKLFVAERAKDYLGKKYGYGKIFTHLCDMILEKILNRSIFLFRRMNRNNNYPICSWVWAYSYGIIGVKFGVKPEYADPDTMYDYVVNDKDWKKIK